ncbi:class I SAM-dependent methyltransferase [Salininema proteolyticum]|uniref:Class I SAM-dependent methyltransferase n=1 Tax=Salininema proteolyticum TaxID=1607685 RepID=A0ABV8U0Z9_9ACTN
MEDPALDPDIEAFYSRLGENDRLVVPPDGRLEYLRTQILLRRLMDGENLRVLDVGGGTGVHSAWLAKDGHAVTLVDPVAAQVEAARTLNGVEAVTGDARKLEFDSGFFDVVLMLGPLYHLVDREDRLAALREGRRVVRDGGLLAVATINRASAWFDELTRESTGDPEQEPTIDEGAAHFETGVLDLVAKGIFTRAYFHRPQDIAEEFTAAGLPAPHQYQIEGQLAWSPHLASILDDPAQREGALRMTELMEADPSLLGVGPHLLSAVRK